MTRLLLALLMAFSILCTGCELDLLGSSSDSSSADAGKLDKSFNDPFGFAVLPDSSGADVSFERAVVQDDGKIVLAGSVCDNATDCDILVARYLSDGTLDGGFGQDGVVTYSAGVNTDDLGQALALASNGRILVAGHTSSSSGIFPIVVGLTSTGVLDTSFGIDGAAIVPLADGVMASIDALAVQGDGKIVACGRSVSGTRSGPGKIWRLTASGALDTTFASGGVYDDVSGDVSRLTGLGVNGDGTIVATGFTSSTVNDQIKALVLRLTALGKLDTSFGSGGHASWADPDGETAAAWAMAIASDGSIFTAGYLATSDGGRDFLVLKFKRAGSLDTGFADDGAFIKDYEELDQLLSLALQSDGRVVAAGFVNDEAAAKLAVIRLLASGQLETGFADEGLFLYPESGGAETFGAGLAAQTGNGLVACGRTDGGEAVEGLVLRLKK